MLENGFGAIFELECGNSDALERRAIMAVSSRSWLRVAGLSGASAVALGTYGAHAFHPEDDHYLATFETANKYHFIHSLLIGLAPSARLKLLRALLTAQLAHIISLYSHSCVFCRRPLLVGSLATAGIALFCGR